MSRAPRRKVLIDARYVGATPHGFARYVGCLARGLAQLEMRERRPYEVTFIVGASTPPRAFPGFRKISAQSGFLSPAELWELPRLIAAEKADLYHSPTFSSLRRCPCPFVLTIHDLNHLHFGGWKEKLYYRLLLKPFALRADVLATVSDFSREEIRAWSGRSEIEVAANAIEPDFNEAVARLPSRLQAMGVQPGRFFLTFSNLKPHKNLGTLIAGYRSYRRKVTDPWPLLLSVENAEQEPGLFQLGPLGDAESKSLMKSAGAVAFPSLYEGFGLPPVEAASAGIPVVVSDIPPHHEGLLDLDSAEVSWIPARDPEAWAAGLERAHRGEVRGASDLTRRKILSRFSTARLGETMDRIYCRVLGL